MSRLITRSVLVDFLEEVARRYGRSGVVYLIGESSQVYATLRSWTGQIDLTSDVPDDPNFASACTEAAERLDVEVLVEFPGDLIPLPDGYEARSRPGGRVGVIDIRHFDPYGTAFRYIARGDEPDYHIVLTYLKHRWIDFEEMDRQLAALLPRFTLETIQQDPAEFRRKYKGLLQMARAIEPGTVHRHTLA